LGWGIEKVAFSVQKLISEMWQDSTKVTIDNQQKILYALLIGAKINDLG